MRGFRWIIAGIGILTPLLVILAFVLHYEYVVRPHNLHAAGVLSLTSLQTDISAETVLRPATGSRNAAVDYLEALNAFTARRPTTKPRVPGVVPPDPPIAPRELRLIMRGSEQRECDIYAQENGTPRFVFRTFPDKKPWPFAYVTNPYTMRPYVAPFRRLAQAALNEGLRCERTRKGAEAERIFQAVIRLGWHLRQTPGSLMDVQLGLEIEQKGLHYLSLLYSGVRNAPKRQASWKYGDALQRLSTEIRRKFAQLGQEEAAKRVLREDRCRIWRIEAAIALKSALHFHTLGRLEARSIRRALEAAEQDPDPVVRSAVTEIVALPEKEFRSTREEGSSEANP